MKNESKGSNLLNTQKSNITATVTGTEVVMPTPDASEVDDLVWDDEDIILEEGQIRNEL